MVNILTRFEKCWQKFEDLYRGSNVFTKLERGGTPADIIWSEGDIQRRLSIFCMDEFGEDCVHNQVSIKVTGKRNPYSIDLVITDNQLWWQAVKNTSGVFNFGVPPLDLIVEIAIVLEADEKKSHYPYNLTKARDIFNKVCSIIADKKATYGAICILDKTRNPTQSFFETLQATFPDVRIFVLYD